MAQVAALSTEGDRAQFALASEGVEEVVDEGVAEQTAPVRALEAETSIARVMELVPKDGDFPVCSDQQVLAILAQLDCRVGLVDPLQFLECAVSDA